jgi:hypothetical protein
VWLLLGTTGARVEVEFLPVIAEADCRSLGRAGVASRAHTVVRRAVVAGGMAAATGRAESR